MGSDVKGMEFAIGGAGTADRDSALAREAAWDKDAFCRLYTSYYPRIYSFILKRLGNVADSEDATSRTFEKALRCIDSFDPCKGSFSSWLYKIAINVSNDQLKTGLPTRVSLEELAGALVFQGEDSAAAVQSFVDVTNLIARLDRGHQVVLVLKYFEGMGQEQMAEVLECSRKAVSMRVTRALKSLRKVMREEGYLTVAGGGV